MTPLQRQALRPMPEDSSARGARRARLKHAAAVASGLIIAAMLMLGLVGFAWSMARPLP